MTDHLPYVPDIDRLLNTLRKMGASQIGDWEGDSYATFWVKENAAVLSGDNYTVAASFRYPFSFPPCMRPSSARSS